MTISEDVANEIYDVLVEECKAPERMREDFISFCSRSYRSREYRFIGNLGFGGKFWHNDGRFYVTCYSEDETEQRRKAIKAANERLAEIFAKANA